MQINDFFIFSNPDHHIPEEGYQKIDLMIKSFEAIARVTYPSLYIIDYYKKDLLYVSGNPLLLCGHTPEEVKNQGFQYFMQHVPVEEHSVLSEINGAICNFFHNLPVGERLDYAISYDFHLFIRNRKKLVNHKLTPLVLDKNGEIWFAACVVSLSSFEHPGHLVIQKKNEVRYWQYLPEKQVWKECAGITLSEREKEVLILSAQGYTMKEIAEAQFVSLDTVKSYKRKLFEKLGVRNITAALSFAINYKLL